MEHTGNPIFKPNKIVALILYIFMTYIGSSIILILITKIYASTHENVLFEDLLSLLIAKDLDEALKNTTSSLRIAYGKVNAIGNMMGYLIMLLTTCFYMRNYLIEDTLEWKSKYKYLLWFIPVAALVFYGLSFGIDSIISSLVDGSSQNQNTIVLMIQNGGAFYMFIAVVICAPIVEELIYRKAIFSFLEKKHIAWSYVVSTIFFTLPHMITTTNVSPGDWFLLAIPYAVSAVMLAAIYHLSKKNIYATWFAHLLNNLISFIIIVIAF